MIKSWISVKYVLNTKKSLVYIKEMCKFASLIIKTFRLDTFYKLINVIRT